MTALIDAAREMQNATFGTHASITAKLEATLYTVQDFLIFGFIAGTIILALYWLMGKALELALAPYHISRDPKVMAFHRQTRRRK